MDLSALTPGLALALGAALVGAAFVRGYSGFGFSAIFLAFAALVTDPVPLIPLCFTCEVAMTAVQARGLRGAVDWRRLGPLFAGAAVVMPFSVAAITSIGPDLARLVLSALIGAMALLLLSGWTVRGRIGPLGNLAVGGIAGAANGAGVGGLPVAVTLAAQALPPRAFRATMIVFLAGIDLYALPFFWVNGAFGPQSLPLLAAMLPLTFLGVALGGRRFLSASPEAFRRLAVLLLLGLAALGLFRSLLALVA